jgi:hypothetical protein
MKTALAIVCSLMLAWTNIVLAQAPEAGMASTAPSCCHCGKKTGCCAANRSLPESQPVSAAPASTFQNQFSLPLFATVAWTLPGAVAHELSESLFPPLTMTGTALLARNCAWLI